LTEQMSDAIAGTPALHDGVEFAATETHPFICKLDRLLDTTTAQSALAEFRLNLIGRAPKRALQPLGALAALGATAKTRCLPIPTSA
jgi:hypothetical protein